MNTLTGTGLAEFAKSKVGTPYVYGAKGANGKFTKSQLNYLSKAYPKMFTAKYLAKIESKKLVGKVCCDCSGLISWYTGKVLGSSQLYSQAYARLPITQWKNFAVGTVLWKSGHVGVYLGDGLVAEEKGIDYGCIISKVTDTKWSYGLTFSWIDYNISASISSTNITYKSTNPYNKPNRVLKIGCVGEDVKWLQWELVESGYNIKIDGDFGKKTKEALIKFQRSCKIADDAKCGNITINKLIAA